MILFFEGAQSCIFAVQVNDALDNSALQKLIWLFGQAQPLNTETISQEYIGPRASMVSPWSTNAVEITQNMGINGIQRIEKFRKRKEANDGYDPMVEQAFKQLSQDLFTINQEALPVQEIVDIAAYNEQEGLALSEEEIGYLEQLSKKLNRPLTDSEVFGFSQVNSEHCRHKIFNGTFIIDGEEMPQSLFQLIKETSKQNPNTIVSAYKDNVAFVEGPKAIQFAPKSQDKPDFYETRPFDSVLSLKAETHNFPTTVEPFNGAATGSGGEIRDRLAGGKGSIPLAGTAVYMTAYSRLNGDKKWEQKIDERKWLYQTPIDILIKASNGASDFGNKFGQPLIAGSVLTFENESGNAITAYDKVIMLAGGIGYGKADQALKETPKKGDKIVILGGDNYRIGMGGAAVSSADTGEFSTGIELNAVQRSNPEMQKRAANAIRSMVESEINPLVSIHDHGAGGHLNCLSELVEDTGGKIDLGALPIGDPSLSAREIIGNESQERMGLVIAEENLEALKNIADRERSPMYVVGEVTGDHRFSFESEKMDKKPIDLELGDMFGSSPKTIMEDQTLDAGYDPIEYDGDNIQFYIRQVLSLEAVACKDWLTNKVDRCVGGRVAKQQCAGPLQLPLNNCGVMAMDFEGKDGIATSIGHAPGAALVDVQAGSENSIAEALTNIIWAPLNENLKSVSLSANWMWPCRNKGEDARLYRAVKTVSEFAKGLGINIPTGKDSLSMKQKYPDKEVLSPGTVIISAVAHCDDINNIVEPVLLKGGQPIYYVDFSFDSYKLGGSSFAQVRSTLGEEAPGIKDYKKFGDYFNGIQTLIKEQRILAGHDISAGGLLTCLLEMCFSDTELAADIDLSQIEESDIIKLLFAENAGIVFQANDYRVEKRMDELNMKYYHIGNSTDGDELNITKGSDTWSFNIPDLRDAWYETSYLLDKFQTTPHLAKARYENYKNQALSFTFPKDFTGIRPDRPAMANRPKAAVIREKGSNSERELANALYLAGFDVKDVHMTDLVTGRETLEDIQFLGAVGGFSNSDVLGSAKGWAGAFMYNETAKKALDAFFSRDDVLSVGICNGCQLFVELDLINPEHPQKSKMLHNESGKHESAFTSVKIQKNNSVMMKNLEGCELGVWISNGEGNFHLPMSESDYHIVAKYSHDAYPSNPSGSDYNTAFLSSKDGRHLVLMPHIERSIFKWNWAHYPEGREDDVSPWIIAFQNAFDYLNKG